MITDHPNSHDNDCAQLEPSDSANALAAFHVICVDLNSVDLEQKTIDHVELWVKARDYDEAVKQGQDFMGPGFMAITVMSKDGLSDCAGYLDGFEEEDEMVVEARC